MRMSVLALTAALLPAVGWAAEPVVGVAPSSAQLAGTIQELLQNNLPEVMAKGEPGWGNQIPALIDPKQMRNHGIWRRYTITPLNPKKTLKVEANNVAQPDNNRTTFDLLVGLDVQFDMTQQRWERGLRLYSASVKARARGFAALQVEATSRIVKGNGLLPDLVFRLRVKRAKLAYSGLDVVHLAGIGGDGAKLLGEAVHETIKLVKPSLERELLEKASAALVKAGDTKEVRVSLGKLFK
jgi:hypothetical protein